jgi:N-acetylglutamate synthase-like GNAT family acetyltransferase
MYVRDAKNREEVWLLDQIEAMELDDTAFRSRDYVVAVDEETNAKAGFGRLRVHKTDEDDVVEFNGVGVLKEWREQGVGAHVVERLVGHASDQGFETAYALTEEPGYLAQFGFRRIDDEELPEKLRERLAEQRDGIAPDAVPVRLQLDRFRMPERLRDRFKNAKERREPDDETSPEEFGIDPDSATYKYDTGR